MAKERLDRLLLEKGLVESRQRAKALIMAGKVLVNEQKVSKAGTMVDKFADIRVIKPLHPYVSRGGLKLECALDVFKISVDGFSVLDVGSSTGGFTDCLIQRGATLVHCVDVGKGQLHWRLRTDPRIVLHEGMNARYMSVEDFPNVQFNMVVMDVSFISQKMIFPSIKDVLSEIGLHPGYVISLVKPQFEAGRKEVQKGGLIKDESVRHRVLEEVKNSACENGFLVKGVTVSPITGSAGNVEYLLFLQLEKFKGMQQ